MSRFAFSLAQVLSLRGRVEEQALARADDLRRQVAALTELLHGERDAYFEEREGLNAAVRAGEFSRVQLYERCLEARKSRMMTIMESLQGVRADLDLAEQALVQARRDVKALENLREKRQGEHAAKLERSERAFFDEQALQRAGRAAHGFAGGEEAPQAQPPSQKTDPSKGNET